MIHEDQVEQLTIEWFKELGYDHMHGSELTPEDGGEREGPDEVILRRRLYAALKRLNPALPDAAIEEATDVLRKPGHVSLIENNRAFHKMLTEGIAVEVDTPEGKRGERVRVVDFQNPSANDWLVVNQLTIRGTKGNRRPDITVYLNGLPVAVIELKNPADENADIYKAYNQLQTYKEEIEQLFVFNEALVISDGIGAQVGSLTASQERFMCWRTVRSEEDKPQLSYELETLIRGFFDPTLLTEYLRYFVLFEEERSGIVKKIAGYHQFHAVRKATESVVNAARTGSRKGGVVWHTQGSGKSISMVCLAAKLSRHPALNNPTVVVITDRNDLDGQLLETFTKASMLLGQKPVQAESVDELRRILGDKPAGGIVFSTIQKFTLKEGESRFPTLSERENIIVIADEAHRSQYGFDAVLDGESGCYRYGYARHLRDALPHATFIGFTGTPVESDDRSTRAVFGEYISIYDIEDAVRDGATVPIYYESRLVKLGLDEDAMRAIDEEIAALLSDEEEAGKERIKSRWSALEKLVGAQKRIEAVARDIVAHFEARQEAIEGKAMVVAMSRPIAVALYDAIVKIRPEWHSDDPMQGAVKVIMTGSASDDETLQPHIYAKKVRKRLERRFKDPDDPLKMVIVRDMWLTGFDAPCLHTLYVDKPMRGHNLMQAIARVNRVFRDKSGGLVVDYIGIANELKAALKVYTGAGGKGKGTFDAAEALAQLRKHLEIIEGMFHGFDYSAYRNEAHRLLVPAANHILGLEEGKKRYLDEVAALSKAFSLCATLDEAQQEKEKVAFFQAVKAVIWKASSPSGSKQRTAEAIRQILNHTVVSEGIEDIFALAGLEKPNIGILSDEFLDEVAQMEHKNLAVALLERLLRDEVKARSRRNVILERKFSERLRATLTKYHNRAVETAKVIEELIAMAKAFSEAVKAGEKLGLDDDELAFYDALAENESALRDMGDETLKKIAQELTTKLRNSISVDWQYRESVRAKMRNMIRIILRRYKYPPDQQPRAVKLVMEQAEALSDLWSTQPPEKETYMRKLSPGESEMPMAAEPKTPYGNKS